MRTTLRWVMKPLPKFRRKRFRLSSLDDMCSLVLLHGKTVTYLAPIIHHLQVYDPKIQCSDGTFEPKPLFVGCNTLRLHGNMKHDERMTTFNAFKNEKSALLLSTDVSARGLDFPKVRCIIQYDSPGEATEYVHRVGRTARLGEKGDSLLFLQPVEIDYLQDLNNHGVSLTEYPLLKLLDSFPLYGIKPQAKSLLH